MGNSSKALGSINRRNFLKSSGLAAGAAILPAASVEASTREPVEHKSSPATAASPVSLVNLFQGTDSSSIFSRGNTLPIAAYPFGMAHWTLQSHEDSPWMFQPRERRLQGIRSTHQLSPWLGDYGHATFLPFSGSIQPEASSRASSYRPEDARLSPHSMRLTLLRYEIDVELIPTERGALMTAQFTKPDKPGWLIDIPGDRPPTWQPDQAHRSIAFTSTENQGGVPKDFATYYLLRFSHPWTSVELKQLQGHTVARLYFDQSVRNLEVRTATSFISFEQAQRNLDLEIGTQSADTLRHKAESVWNQHLSRIELSGATVDQQRTFYSCLYRTLLFPRIWHEPDATGVMHHLSPYNGNVVPGVMYADHGFWDVYRAWYPLMTILFPERLSEILQAWVNVYKEGDWLPQFPCPGYRSCMTGSLIDSLFGDAAVKNLQGFDLATAYAGLRKHATQPGNPDAGYGRRGVEQYLKYGYVPADLVRQSAAETVDAAYGDFCIAQVAKTLGHADDYKMFMLRSESWRHLFDPTTLFLRGKKADGHWLEPFDPITWGDPYVEGSAWQHRWDVPHDMDGLISLLGGPAKTVAILEDMITRRADFNVGTYGDEIHEMSEMAAVPFGQYAHSNQPVHHVLYIFAAAGRPDRTRYWVRKVVEELYSPDRFPGDEDTGSMAAWYIFSSLGFYPLCPGKPEYMLGQALFPSIKVHLPNDKILQIETSASPTAATVVAFNGMRIQGSSLSHAALMQGGHLTFR